MKIPVIVSLLLPSIELKRCPCEVATQNAVSVGAYCSSASVGDARSLGIFVFKLITSVLK
jgi:hypothetical protein